MQTISRLKLIVFQLGDHQILEHLLGPLYEHENWIKPRGRGFDSRSISKQDHLVSNRLGSEFDDLLPQVDLDFVRLEGVMDPFSDRDRDAVYLWRKVGDHDPRYWQRGIAFDCGRAHSHMHLMYDGRATVVARGEPLAFEPDKSGTLLYAIRASYPAAG